jgi:hypothetical protein
VKYFRDTPILNIKGEPVIHSDREKTPATFGSLAVEALLNRSEDEKGQATYRNWKLAQKIEYQQIIDLSHEECILLKKKVGESPIYTTTVIGAFFDIIESPIPNAIVVEPQVFEEQAKKIEE